MLSGKNLTHHGRICRYRHSVNVACLSFLLAKSLHIPVRDRELVRGALLHDYYLYDRKQERTRGHLRSHAKRAHDNAVAEFSLSPVERDIIRRHMFPLNPTPPRYREGLLVCTADKLCAIGEFFGLPAFTK